MVKQRKGIKEELITPLKAMEPKTVKPTPEQMRIAQILEKKVVDSTIKTKIKQIMDATQRSAEEVYVALHDSDFDVNRAVNLLIEREDQLADWCTNEKRKKKLAESKEKKEEVVEAEIPVPEKNTNPVRGRRDDKWRTGRRQDDGRRPPKQQGEPRKQQIAPRPKRPGFESVVFERSNPPTVDVGLLPPIKNHWEKPLVCTRTSQEDWDYEEFQGSLSQTQIFTSSKKQEPQEMQQITNGSSPPPTTRLPLVTFTNKAHEHDEVPVTPQKRDPFINMRSNATSSHNTTSTFPSENPPDFFRLGCTKNEDKRPPSKIPTSAVEMPPELMPSLSFLDIQFGAMDLCTLEATSESQSTTTLQNTALLPPSNTPSQCSMVSNISVSSSNNTSTLANTKLPPPALACTDSPAMDVNFEKRTSGTSPPGLNSTKSILTNNSQSNVNQSLNSIASSPRDKSTSLANPALTTNAVPPSSISGSISHITQDSIQQGANITSGAPKTVSHMVPNNMNRHLMGPSATIQNRFMPSSQVFHGSHMQYGIINPPGSSHGYESRDDAPPTHLPPFKSPPGVPKGSMGPNLPTGPIVSNQYLVGQGNVPYFPPPIYYYEEVPPVMNPQQRLTNMTSHHYDVSYQTAPSSRDSVHYNV